MWKLKFETQRNEREYLGFRLHNESALTDRFEFFIGLLNCRHLGGDFDTAHRAATRVVVAFLDINGVQIEVCALAEHRGLMFGEGSGGSPTRSAFVVAAGVDEVREHAGNQRPQVGKTGADDGDVAFSSGPEGGADVVPCTDMLVLLGSRFSF